MYLQKLILHVLLGLKCTPQVEAHVCILSKSDDKNIAVIFG